MNKQISFIITHYKQPEFLDACVRSIKKYVKSFDYEIIVADSDTIEETRNLVKSKFPDVVLSKSKANIGFSKIVNRALRLARGSHIVILNADILLNDSSIEEIFEFLNRNKDVGLVGPALFGIDGSPQNSAFRFYGPLTIAARRTFLGKVPPGKKDIERFLMAGIDLSDKPTPVDWLMGSSLFLTKKALEDVGPLDERYFMYFEDVDWARRFWKNGYRVIYYPRARLTHHHLKSSKKSGGVLDVLFNKYTRIHLASAIKYFLKFGLKVPKYGA